MRGVAAGTALCNSDGQETEAVGMIMWMLGSYVEMQQPQTVCKKKKKKKIKIEKKWPWSFLNSVEVNVLIFPGKDAIGNSV